MKKKDQFIYFETTFYCVARRYCECGGVLE